MFEFARLSIQQAKSRQSVVLAVKLRRVFTMHMADALVSPQVGGALFVAAAGVAAYSLRKVKNDFAEYKVPLMGVMGAFVFAAQMINFTIPGTGSSGHIGGGILLAILLGPYAGFLTMASILVVQALFFGDGGLLALGCNIINMGLFTCFVAYPLIYKPIAQRGLTRNRIFIGALLSVVVGLQMGAFSVVMETLLSGKTELPFGTFVMLMQPIHLAIGAVEGLITGSVVAFIYQARPELLDSANDVGPGRSKSFRKVFATLAAVTLVVGGVLSWFASSNPDGLEWAMERTAGTAELAHDGTVHSIMGEVQEKTAFLPDYGFAGDVGDKITQYLGTSVSGIVGGGLTLGLCATIGMTIIHVKNKKGSTL